MERAKRERLEARGWKVEVPMFTSQRGPAPGFFRCAPALGALALFLLGASTIIGLIKDAPLVPVYGLLLVLAVLFGLDLAWQSLKQYPAIRLDDDGLTVRVLNRWTQKVKWHVIEDVLETETDSYAVLISPFVRSPLLTSGLSMWERPFQPVVFISKRTPGAGEVVKAIRAHL